MSLNDLPSRSVPESKKFNPTIKKPETVSSLTVNSTDTTTNTTTLDQNPSPHPYSTYKLFNENPPIPVFNYVISNKTLEILEDKTGQP